MNQNGVSHLPQLNVKFRKLVPEAVTPYYASKGAAGLDFSALSGAVVPAHSSVVLRTGISVAVPAGYGLFMLSRSGHGFKFGVRLANCVGLVDSDYRGEVMVKLTNDSDTDYTVAAHDRIAQGVILPTIYCNMIECDSLDETERGVNGFGSTSKLSNHHVG